jgi:hypothetical protein
MFYSSLEFALPLVHCGKKKHIVRGNLKKKLHRGNTKLAYFAGNEY